MTTPTPPQPTTFPDVPLVRFPLLPHVLTIVVTFRRLTESLLTDEERAELEAHPIGQVALAPLHNSPTRLALRLSIARKMWSANRENLTRRADANVIAIYERFWMCEWFTDRACHKLYRVVGVAYDSADVEKRDQNGCGGRLVIK